MSDQVSLPLDPKDTGTSPSGSWCFLAPPPSPVAQVREHPPRGTCVWSLCFCFQPEASSASPGSGDRLPGQALDPV